MRKTGSSLLALLLAVAALAQAGDDPTAAAVTASVSAERIGLADTLLYTLTFRNIENPAQPDLSLLEDFKVLQTSRSSEFQLRDGGASSSTSYTYYLMPARTGRLSLPEVRYRHQGREYRSQGFVIEVVKGSLAPAQQAPAQPPSLFDDDFFASPFAGGRSQPPDARLRAVVSKSACLKGEQLLYRVLLYTRSRIEAVNMLSSASFAGFWQEWFPVPQSISPTSENVNGVIYQVYEIRKAALFASESGALTIPPLQFELQAGDPGAAFFGSQPLRRSTQALQVQVSEPPASAAGLPVGRFSFALEPDPPPHAGGIAQADVNDIVTLRLTIRGTGNCKAVIPPALADSARFQVYPAKVSQESSYADDAMTGTLRAEVPLAFRQTGEALIPPLEFRYFDPDRRAVVSLRSAPLRIRITGVKAASGIERTLPGSRIVQKGADIEYIRGGALRGLSRPIHRRWWFGLLLAALCAGNLLVLLKTRLWDRHIAQSAPLLSRRILAQGLKRLAAVRRPEEIAPAMEGFVCSRLGLGLAEVSDRRIAETLAACGLSAARVDRFLFIKGQSELARFSAQKKSALELKRDLRELGELFREIDRRLGRP